jgi:membrane-bound metal-dependent hydrolase YbcI (DUF457 family)
VGPHLAFFGQFFIAYPVMFAGSLIGFAYGYVFSFLVGYFVTRMHDWFVDLKEGERKAHA